MDAPWLDPARIPALTSAACGAFLAILFRKGSSMVTVFTTLITAEIMAYFFVQPVWSLMHRELGWADQAWQGPVGLSIGLLAIFIVGGAVKGAEQFAAAPLETTGAALRWFIERFLPRP